MASAGNVLLNGINPNGSISSSALSKMAKPLILRNSLLPKLFKPVWFAYFFNIIKPF